jgi:hypothetical protein
MKHLKLGGQFTWRSIKVMYFCKGNWYCLILFMIFLSCRHQSTFGSDRHTNFKLIHGFKYWGSSNLQLLGYDLWWQKPTEVVCLAFPLWEGEPLVVAGIPQQIVTAVTQNRVVFHMLIMAPNKQGWYLYWVISPYLWLIMHFIYQIPIQLSKVEARWIWWKPL